jgi:superfamily II DNA/RNA helicase
MTFDSLGLPEPLVRAVADAGYAAPTDVQSAAIPPALAGTDLMVASAPGSGKTASFILPALNRAPRRAPTHQAARQGHVYGPRILVLTPRELALQIAKAARPCRRQARLRVTTVVGGVPYPAAGKPRGPPTS